MAHSLKVASGSLLGLLLILLVGCGALPNKTPSQRLTHVLTTQQQADAAYRSNDMKQAAALYLQLTRMVPQEADYWYMLGNTYVRTERPDEAVQAYQQAIARNPNHARAWHNLGIVRMRQAMAAFVSSASAAKTEDPMHDVSTRLVDELARIGAGGVNSQASMAAPLPVTVSRSTVGSAAGMAATGTAATKPAANSPARRRPGASAGADQP